MRRATIRDVARAAGVSTAAVSHAFNTPARLRPTTVERIRLAARNLGYAPNPHARALHSRRAGVIGVLVPQPVEKVFANPFFGSFFAGLGSVTDESGIGLLAVSPVGTSLERAIASAPVDGFVIVGLNEDHEEVSPLRKRGVPFVVVDGDARTTPSVNADDEGGAFAAASYLLAHGHAEICVLGFEAPLGHHTDARYGVGGRRHRGVVRAFEEAGHGWSDDLLLSTPASFVGAEEMFGAHLDGGRRPGAVLAVSDAMAIGALRAAERRGIRVPDELEIIGFDDIPLAALTRPALSTIHQPIAEKGRIAARLLISGLDGGASEEQIVLPTNLVLRDSTKNEKGGATQNNTTATRGHTTQGRTQGE